MTDFAQILDVVDQMIAAAEKESAPECILRGSLSSWRLLRAALSAHSTGSGGVAAEPVAWAWEAWDVEAGEWVFRSDKDEPSPLLTQVRNIRPLCEHPPVAAEPVAGWKLAALLVDEIDGLVGESEGVSGLHRNGDIATWDELLPGGEYERLTSLNDLRTALAAAPTPSAGGGETEAGDLISLSAGATEGEEQIDLRVLCGQLRALSKSWAVFSDTRGLASIAMDQAERVLRALRSGRLVEAAPAAPAGGGETPSIEGFSFPGYVSTDGSWNGPAEPSPASPAGDLAGQSDGVDDLFKGSVIARFTIDVLIGRRSKTNMKFKKGLGFFDALSAANTAASALRKEVEGSKTCPAGVKALRGWPAMSPPRQQEDK